MELPTSIFMSNEFHLVLNFTLWVIAKLDVYGTASCSWAKPATAPELGADSQSDTPALTTGQRK